MLGFLTPFFIAFGIGAGIASVLILLAAVSVTAQQIILLGWDLAKEIAKTPAMFWQAIQEGVADGLEDDRRRQAPKAKR